jgi:hypothetical protein
MKTNNKTATFRLNNTWRNADNYNVKEKIQHTTSHVGCVITRHKNTTPRQNFSDCGPVFGIGAFTLNSCVNKANCMRSLEPGGSDSCGPQSQLAPGRQVRGRNNATETRRSYITRELAEGVADEDEGHVFDLRISKRKGSVEQRDGQRVLLQSIFSKEPAHQLFLLLLRCTRLHDDQDHTTPTAPLGMEKVRSRVAWNRVRWASAFKQGLYKAYMYTLAVWLTSEREKMPATRGPVPHPAARGAG